MSVKTPIYRGLLQSDLDTNGFNILGFTGGGGGLPQGWVSVMDYGAHADGVTDDTSAVQSAIAAATTVVYFPEGNYFFSGSIGAVPAGMSLVGASHFGPNWYVFGSDALASGGTVFMLTANAGSSTGTKFISLTSNSAVVGISFYWPNQLRTATTPTAYPWAVYIHDGNASSVKYCTFVNAYQGIYLENTLDNLVEETRGEALSCGVKMEGNNGTTRLRGVYWDNQWSNFVPGSNSETYRAANAISIAMGRNDCALLDNCFAFRYGFWIYCYDDTAHSGGGPHASWAQIRGGGADECVTGVRVDEAASQGIDIADATLTSIGGVCVVIGTSNLNTESVRVRNCIMYAGAGTFGTVDGSGEVTVDNCYFIADFTGGTTPVVKGTTGWAVIGTGNFALRGCTFRTTQTHVSLGSSLTKAVVIGNMCSDTFVVTNSMTAGSAVIDGNTGQGTVYVGADMRLVAISGGGKIQVRNTGTGVWVDADQWTNP